jgi:hypothetical protein
LAWGLRANFAKEVVFEPKSEKPIEPRAREGRLLHGQKA